MVRDQLVNQGTHPGPVKGISSTIDIQKTVKILSELKITELISTMLQTRYPWGHVPSRRDTPPSLLRESGYLQNLPSYAQICQMIINEYRSISPAYVSRFTSYTLMIRGSRRGTKAVLSSAHYERGIFSPLSDRMIFWFVVELFLDLGVEPDMPKWMQLLKYFQKNVDLGYGR